MQLPHQRITASRALPRALPRSYMYCSKGPSLSSHSNHFMFRSLARLGLLQSQFSPKPSIRSFGTTSSAAAMDKTTGILSWADKSTGEFKRQTSVFRNFISSKPDAEFPAEKGRYHLYVSYACPWGMRLYLDRISLPPANKCFSTPSIDCP